MILLVAGMGATPAGKKNFHADGKEDLIQLPLVKMMIHKKGLNQISDGAKKTFDVSEQTIIVGMDGKEMDIREMLVPCEAQVAYFTENGVPHAQRIDIKKIDPNASNKFNLGKSD
ncbi:MAG: hypothetical protein C4519_08635 [Desulfobacteraceae bacterium]|nr:MAG: hypothetical protein C4519_08635 [Desulfobacteraceae bacterium]